MADNEAKIEITAGTARLPAALRSALKSFQGFAVSVGQALIGSTNTAKQDKQGVSRWGQHALGQTVGNLATRGLDLLVDQGKKVIDFERELTRLGIDLRKQPSDMREIALGIRAISSETGLGADRVLEAGRSYADLAGAEAFTMERMRLIARSAQASGADVKEMAELMFTLTENMKVPPNQLEDTIGGLINQAKDGSIHFKELAHELVALGAVYTQFGVSGREGAIQIGAQMQIARHGFGTASEAATGVLRIYRSIPQHASKFAKAGVDVWTKGSKTQLRSFEDIIHQIQKSPLALNREALIKSFGRTEGERFYQVLTSLAGQYDKLKAAGQAAGVVTKDLGTFTESSAGRMDVAFEKMKNKIAEAFTPERIDAFSHAVEELAGKLGPILTVVGKVADAFGAIHGAGKAIRGFLTPDDSRLAASSAEEIQLEAKAKGISPAEAAVSLQGQHGRRLAAKRAITAATKDDRTTPESDELAVRARFDPRDRTGEGAQAAGAAYIESAGLTPDRVAAIYKKIIEKDIDTEIAGGKGRSSAITKVDMQAAFTEAIKTAMAPALSRALTDSGIGRPPEVNMDGGKVGTAVGNAQNKRRR